MSAAIFYMPKSKHLNFIIKGTVFPYDIMFSFGEDRNRLYKTLKKYEKLTDKDILEALANYHVNPGLMFRFENSAIIVIIRTIPKTSKDYGVLQHEIFHAANHMLIAMGLSCTLESEEAWAYLIGYITDRVYEKLSSL